MSTTMQSRSTYYCGERRPEGVRVWVEDREAGTKTDLPHIEKHSPTGFEWGYQGSGPADLANSILGSHLEIPGGVAGALYQAFKREVIATITPDRWTLKRDQVDAWLQKRWSQMSEDQIREDLRA